MKKLLTLVACTAMLAGCDFLGGSDAPVATVANITITDGPVAAAPDIRIEVQDVAGRAYAVSEHSSASLPLSMNTQFDIYSSARDLAIVVMRDNGEGSSQRYELLGSSNTFDGAALAAASGSSLQVGGGVAATIDVAAGGSAE